MSQTFNIASHLEQMAAKQPDRTAISAPIGRTAGGEYKYDEWTFKQLNDSASEYAHGLTAIGVTKGVRTLLMVRPGYDLIALTFALFKTGAVPVLIDPGMGKNNLLDCVAAAKPDAMMAIPLAHIARLIYPKQFKTVRSLVTVGRRWLWGGENERTLRRNIGEPFETIPTAVDDTAAILFTTGSTGPPKGVVYEHGMFDAQVRLIKQRYKITEDDVDLPAFPLFALFSIAMGMRVVIPDMDPTKPAQADPEKLAAQINGQGVTMTFGSPAIWRRVSKYCVDKGVKLPSLKRVLMAGAPVANKIHDRLLNHVLPENGMTYTPFGATEALPACDIEGREVLDQTAALTAEGKGTCVGRPLPEMGARIIKITENEIAEWDDSLVLPVGEIGEIVVSGPVVTKEYFAMPEKTRLAKIRDANAGRILHRMGDVGYLDGEGRLWFCGRKAHRVITGGGTLFTIPCEAIFNHHPDVFRTALVGIGEAPDQTPVIIAELDKERPQRSRDDIAGELLELGSANPLTQSIRKVLFHPEFPTDIRHNAKIFREKLKIWAEGEL